MTLTPAQEQELHAAVCAAFDLGELTMLVRYRLGDVLAEVAAPGPLGQVVFDLIAAYGRRGRLAELVRAVYHERPRNPQVVAFCERHAAAVVRPAAERASLDSPDRGQRLLALARVGVRRDDGHLQRVVGLLQTEADAEVRARAAWALDQLGRPEATAALVAALDDPDWGVRSSAGWALVHLGPQVAADVRRVAAGSANPDAREMAGLVLERL